MYDEWSLAYWAHHSSDALDLDWNINDEQLGNVKQDSLWNDWISQYCAVIQTGNMKYFKKTKTTLYG